MRRQIFIARSFKVAFPVRSVLKILMQIGLGSPWIRASCHALPWDRGMAKKMRQNKIVCSCADHPEDFEKKSSSRAEHSENLEGNRGPVQGILKIQSIFITYLKKRKQSHPIFIGSVDVRWSRAELFPIVFFAFGPFSEQLFTPCAWIIGCRCYLTRLSKGVGSALQEM